MSVKFIAEIGANHNQNLDRCGRLIDAAANIGADAIKAQLFRADRLFAPEILQRSAKHRAQRAWELPIEFLPQIAAQCQWRGIEFGCTPLYLEAVEELRPFVDFYKIASYELLWDDLLCAVAGTGKPVVLSVGMATRNEIVHAAGMVRPRMKNGEPVWLHCVSGYPCPIEDCNLSAIDTIRNMGAVKRGIGWSDHSRSPGVIYSAVFEHHASMIEFHLDLDGSGAEYGGGHCWLPEEIAPVIRDVRDGERAQGDGVKRPAPSELAERDWRRDPLDGLRPMRSIRASFGG